MTYKKALLTISAGAAGLAGVALLSTQVPDKVQAATQTATVSYDKGATTVWASPNFNQAKTYVNYKQTVTIYGSKQVGGTTWYLIGDNAWVPGMYLSFDTSNTTAAQAPKAPSVTNTASTTANTTNTPTSSAATTAAKPAAAPDNTNTKLASVNQTQAQKVITLAEQQIGKPYVWGGKGPDSFDCSGLMEYVFSNALGMDIGSWTVPQESAGQTISVSQAQPGDLLFWGNHGSTYHVALYIGGNQYINAPIPGENVQTATISQYFEPSFAVRVL